MRPNEVRPIIVILLLWAGITAIDFNKAIHIDETFHLKAAQWIEHHPGRPMSGYVNWGMDPEPIHAANQPPGFFYLVAITGHLFGYSEGPMHAMRSLFSLLALVCFHRLARHRAPAHALWLTALFAFCPAFMVNQGLMTDVPLLAMQLLFFNLLLVPGTLSTGPRYAWAGLALSGAMFIKYTTAPLLLVFPMVIVLRREWRRLPLALIPWLLLVAWSLWNLHEYGHIHLLDREAGDSSPRGILVKTLALFCAIGAVSPFTPAFLRALVPKRTGWALPAMIVSIILGVLLCMAAYTGMIPEVVSDQVLRVTFTLNGVLVTAYCVRSLPRSIRPSNTDTWALALWAAGLALFLVCFSPMMATRHILLIIPAVLLLIAPALDQVGIRTKALAVAITAMLGTLLTISDKVYAGFYRDLAPVIASEMKARTTGTVWSLGHWGWQWYSEQADMSIYGLEQSHLRIGDIVVIPEEYDAQELAPGTEMEPIASWDGPPGWDTFFCVEQFASMYTSSYGKLPWTLSRSHHKIIKAYRITAVR